MEEKVIQVQPPSLPTLRKYGLTRDEWWAMWREQGEICPICKRYPSTGRTVIDHYHFKGFKRLRAEEKREYIRGICCWFCNRFFLAKGITVEKAQNMVEYLENAEKKRNVERKPPISLQSNSRH